MKLRLMFIYSDATAAIGMVKRLGLGRVRHLSVADLWIQQRIRRGGMTMSKWPGSQNPADLMTKCLGRADTMRFTENLSFAIMSGRPIVSPLRQGKWATFDPPPGLAPTVRVHRHLRSAPARASWYSLRGGPMLAPGILGDTLCKPGRVVGAL